MKLFDLIHSNHWLSVELTLGRLYPDQKSMLDDYRAVFEKLTMAEPVENDMEIVLVEYENDTEFDIETGTYVDVSGRKKNPEPNSLTESYALEFTAWNKWLGMNIEQETEENFSELEIIAHCLYEMTFVSFDEEEICDKFSSINESVEEYKKMTEEEKKAKTISLDELIKRVENKKDNTD